MRKTFIITLLLCSSWLMNAQNSIKYYQKMFDDRTTWEHSITYEQDVIYGIGTDWMEGLLTMYETTNDLKYLHSFVQYAKNVIDRRDDLRNTDILGPYTVQSSITNFIGETSPTWSSIKYNSPAGGAPYPLQYNNAKIIYPIAKFCYIVLKGSTQMQNTIVAQQPTAGTFPCWNQYAGTSSFKTVAEYFLDRAKETMNYYDKESLNLFEEVSVSGNEMGYYREFDYANARYPRTILPLNMQSAIARTLMYLHLADEGSSSNAYLAKVRKIATYIKNKTIPTQYTSDPGLNKYNWHYWGGDQESVLLEDVDHANMTIIFPFECYKNDIRESNGSKIYTEHDLKAYANTLTQDVYVDVLKMRSGVSHYQTVNQINTWNFKTDENTINLQNDSTKGKYLYKHWMAYSEVEPKIYQILNDFNTSSRYLHPSDPTINYDNGDSYYMTNPTTIAYLAKYDQALAPIAAEHGWGIGSKWAGVAAGNFDGDAADGEEYVMLRNFDYKIAIQNKVAGKAKLEGTVESLVPNSGNGLFHADTLNYRKPDFKWAGVAAGDFFGDSKDEIITISNCSDPWRNGYYVFNINGSNEIEFDVNKSALGFGTSSNWAGITAGNFVAGGKDDFIIARNNDRRVYVYKSENENIHYVTMMTLDSTIGANSEIAAIASGNIDGVVSNGDELAVLVNGPGTESGLYIYSMDLSDTNEPLKLLTKMSGWGSGGEFRGLAVGNYNANEKDDILIHRNHDAHYRLYEYNPSKPQDPKLDGIGAEFFDIRQTKDNILAAGNFESESVNDELIALRNTDSGIILYQVANYTPSTPPSISNPVLLSINDATVVDKIQSILLYPNPNDGMFYIDSKLEDSKALVTVLDCKGIVVIEKVIASNHEQIDMSSYASGLYLVKVKVKNEVYTKKVMKK